MSLILRAEIAEAHPKNIHSIAYNVYRRELYVGGEDGTIIVWDSETQKQLNVFAGHHGWVTGLIYCKELRMLISVSLDGKIILWAANGKMVRVMNIATPIYSISYNAKRYQILLGMNKKVKCMYIMNSEDAKILGNISDETYFHKHTNTAKEHSDIVGCVSCLDGRFISAGFDKRIVIYEQSHPTDKFLSIIKVIDNAHDSAITCITTGKDHDNTWFVTGSHDCTVKLWSIEGSLIRKFNDFTTHISSLCYIEPTQTLWISANSVSPVIIDTRSGMDISEFLEDSAHSIVSKDLSSTTSIINRSIQSPTYKMFWYICDSKEVVGINNRRRAKIWHFDQFSALTVLRGHNDGLECIAHTSAGPVLMYTCGDDAVIRKWERLQIHASVYSQQLIDMNFHNFSGPTEESIEHANKVPQKDIKKLKEQELKRKKEINSNFYLTKLKEIRSVASFNAGDEGEKMNLARQIELLSSETQKIFKRTLRLNSTIPVPKDSAALEAGNSNEFREKNFEDTYGYIKKHSVSKMVYHDALEYLLCASHDDVMGYDKGFFGTGSMTIQNATQYSNASLASLNDKTKNTDYASGFVHQFTFSQHKAAVTSFAIIAFNGTHYMISSGWDKRLCLWNLDTFTFGGTYKNTSKESGGNTIDEFIADGVVTDIAYSLEREEFAYSSADKLVYIRKFSPIVQDMTLKVVLHGHQSEVNFVRWFSKNQNWITAAEDLSIRFWSGDGLSCLRVLNNERHITCMLLDDVQNCLVIGSSDTIIRAYDLDRKENFPCHVYRGHTDEVRDIIMIKERKQYVSISRDNTLRVWNSFKWDEEPKKLDMEVRVIERKDLTSFRSTFVDQNNDAEDNQKTITEFKNQMFEKDLQEAVDELENFQHQEEKMKIQVFHLKNEALTLNPVSIHMNICKLFDEIREKLFFDKFTLSFPQLDLILTEVSSELSELKLTDLFLFMTCLGTEEQSSLRIEIHDCFTAAERIHALKALFKTDHLLTGSKSVESEGSHKETHSLSTNQESSFEELVGSSFVTESIEKDGILTQTPELCRIPSPDTSESSIASLSNNITNNTYLSSKPNSNISLDVYPDYEEEEEDCSSSKKSQSPTSLLHTSPTALEEFNHAFDEFEFCEADYDLSNVAFEFDDDLILPCDNEGSDSQTVAAAEKRKQMEDGFRDDMDFKKTRV